MTRGACFARPFREDWLGWSVEDGRKLDVVGIGLGVMAGEREGKGIVVENAGEGHVWKRRTIASWDAGQPRQRDSTSNISATTNLVSHQASSLRPSLDKFFIFWLLILLFAIPYQGTALVQVALSLQTRPPSTTPVPLLPLSVSCPLCGLSLRIWQHLHRKTTSGCYRTISHHSLS